MADEGKTYEYASERLTAEVARELLDYSPDTGKLLWRPRGAGYFSSKRGHSVWNSRYPGSEALSADCNGYKKGRILGDEYYAHRVVWFITYGEWPDQIDHINGDKSDNRIENLRAVTAADNARNKPLRTDNTSGHVGVNWRPDCHRWTASITAAGKRVNLGVFTNKTEAVAARMKAERRYGFHENHGRVA